MGERASLEHGGSGQGFRFKTERPADPHPPYIQLALNHLRYYAPRWAESLGLSEFYKDVRYFEDGNIVLCLHTLAKGDPQTGRCAISLATPDELRTGEWRKNAERVASEAMVRVSMGLSLK